MKGRSYVLHRIAALLTCFVLPLCTAFSQPSLQPGIAQTQAALDQIDKLLEIPRKYNKANLKFGAFRVLTHIVTEFLH